MFRQGKLLLFVTASLAGVLVSVPGGSAASAAARAPGPAPAKGGVQHITIRTAATRGIALNANGCLEAFVRDPADGSVWHAEQRQSGTDWSDWSSLGQSQTAAQDPVVATNADGRLEVFVTKSDGTVWSLAPTTAPAACGTAWDSGQWVSHGGAAQGIPAAATNTDGRLEVFVVGTDGHLYSMSQTVAGSVYGENWAAWTDMGTPQGGSFTSSPAVAMGSGGRLQVFARGSDGRIWTCREKKASGTAWSGWRAIAGLKNAASMPTVAANATAGATGGKDNGRLQVFVRASDNTLWYAVQRNPRKDRWAKWKSLGGPVAGSPVVTRNQDGRLEVFVRDPGNSLEHVWQTQPNAANSWSPLTSLPGAVLAGDPSLVANQDGRLEAFGRQADSTLWHLAQNEPGAPPGTDWTTWENLGYGAEPCTGTGSLACVNVTNVGDNKALTPDGNHAGDPVVDASVTTDTSQRWSLARNTDGSFQLVNHATQQCLDTVNGGAAQQACQGGASQNWYLEPVTANQTYLIHQVSTGQCLRSPSWWFGGDDPDSSIRAVTEGCDSSRREQQWHLGISGDASGTMNLAIRYALAQCSRSGNSCSFSLAGNQPAAYLDQHACVPGTLVYNGTSAILPTDLTATVSEGWQNDLGGSLTLTHEFGGSAEVISAKVSTAIKATYQHSWIGNNSTTVTGSPDLQPGYYGWLEKGLVAKKAVGTWSFTESATWTLPGQSAVPALDGTDTVSESATGVYTGTTPPANC